MPRTRFRGVSVTKRRGEVVGGRKRRKKKGEEKISLSPGIFFDARFLAWDDVVELIMGTKGNSGLRFSDSDGGAPSNSGKCRKGALPLRP